MTNKDSAKTIVKTASTCGIFLVGKSVLDTAFSSNSKPFGRLLMGIGTLFGCVSVAKNSRSLIDNLVDLAFDAVETLMPKSEKKEGE